MNNQYNQQPQYQQQYAPQPQRPMIDPMIAKQQKKDAFNALSEKAAAFMQTNPVLKGISSFSDIISYFVTGVSAIMTIILMCLGGISQIFAVLTLLFGVLSLSKKSILPFTVALSSLSAFGLVNFILSIVHLAQLGKWGVVSGSAIVSFIFSIVELIIIGCFTALAWTYFVAMLPPKMYQPQQPYYGGQPMQQPMQPQQPVMQQPVQPVQTQQPVMQQPAVSVEKTCPACGSANADGADFCKICGSKL